MSAEISEEVLSQIHESLAKELLIRIQEGTATPTDLNVARQMLKDNNITVTPASNSPLVNILDDLPYDEKGTIIRSETIEIPKVQEG
tara:strand:- start:9671 stop:9931 length:261 start_codon:yes stop_codon:yes gene_type:complete